MICIAHRDRAVGMTIQGQECDERPLNNRRTLNVIHYTPGDIPFVARRWP
jgi:hypothetical protein